MDRTFVTNFNKTPVNEIGLDLWRDHIVKFPNIRDRMLNTLLDLIHTEWTGEIIDQGLMHNVIKMLMDLGPSVYHDDFEKSFLDVTANFYRIESQQFIECCDCGDYMKKAEGRINEEMERVSNYLDPKSEIKITTVVEREMIANHMTWLVHMENSGVGSNW